MLKTELVSQHETMIGQVEQLKGENEYLKNIVVE